MRDRIVIIDINTKKFKAVSYKQYDENNILQVVITNNGSIIGLSNYEITVFFQLPSGKVYETQGTVVNNTINITLTNAILSESGKVTVEIELCNNENVITTFSIYLNIEKSINKEVTLNPSEDADVPDYHHNHKNKFVLDQITIDSLIKWDNSSSFSGNYDDLINKPNLEEFITEGELENFATEEFVRTAIAQAQLEGSEVDLSGYITETEFSEINTQVNKNTNDISLILKIIDEPPIYIEPSLTISLSSINIEHNKQTNVKITPNFKQNDAGDVDYYCLNRDGEDIYINSSMNIYTDEVTLQHGESLIYNATVYYKDGVIKNTSLGVPYPETSIKANNKSANATIKCYALSYYGIIDTKELYNVDYLTSILRTSRSSTLTFNLNNQRIVYMYPKSFGNLTSIKDGNNFDYVNSYTLSTMILDDVEYNVYILTDTVTINGFKQIFN